MIKAFDWFQTGEKLRGRRREGGNLLWLVGTLVLLGLTGCGSTASVNQAGRLADAGIAYADAVPTFYDESFALAGAADSLVLEQNRNLLMPDERIDALTRSDTLLSERLQILRDLKAHARALRAYFVALKSLIGSEGAGQISEATKGLIDRLGKLHEPIAAATIGDRAVSEFVDPVVSLAVAAYQSRALHEELEARAETVERELALQKAAINALGEQMLADWDLQVQIEERNPLQFEFAEDGPLPPDWSERRIASLKKTAHLATLEVAAKAAENLHQSWIAFAEGRVGEGSLLLLIRDIEELVQLAAKFEAEV